MMIKKSILILGAGGLLGHKLCQLLPQEYYSIYASVRQPKAIYQTQGAIYQHVTLLDNIDALNEAGLNALLFSIRPDVIINAIGIVKQLQSAHDPYLSVGINAFLPHRLARLCQQIGAHLIHMSTDCVFDGKKGQYAESDVSNAEDLYGKSKFLGETTADESNAVTLRTSIIGHELQSPTHGLLEWALSQRGKTIKGFTQAYFSGFTSNELVGIIHRVIQKHLDLRGVYHVASHVISKYDLLKRINQAYDLRLTIEADETFHCDRSLQMQRFITATGYQAPAWDTMIATMQRDSDMYEKQHCTVG
jgi:dTDP-4-dehydrorhamnose reductase